MRKASEKALGWGQDVCVTHTETPVVGIFVILARTRNLPLVPLSKIAEEKLNGLQG